MNKRLRYLSRLAVALGLALATLSGASGVDALAGPSISFDLSTPTLYVGQSATVDVLIAADDLFGYQFTVDYDTTRLTATSATFLTSWFDGSFTPWAGAIDDGAGTVCFAASLERGDTAPTGQGAVARITFRADAEGTANLAFSGVKLVRFVGGEAGTEIIAPVTQAPASLTVLNTATINGAIRLQGRANHAGATVTADGTSATSAADGSFGLTVTAGTWTVEATRPYHLAVRKAGVTANPGATVTLSTAVLEAGDADDSGTIDISDAAIIGGDFGKTSGFAAGADANGDGEVDIVDLVLMGGNFGDAEPLAW